jgi:hypothetical protein
VAGASYKDRWQTTADDVVTPLRALEPVVAACAKSIPDMEKGDYYLSSGNTNINGPDLQECLDNLPGPPTSASVRYAKGFSPLVRLAVMKFSTGSRPEAYIDVEGPVGNETRGLFERTKDRVAREIQRQEASNWGAPLDPRLPPPSSPPAVEDKPPGSSTTTPSSDDEFVLRPRPKLLLDRPKSRWQRIWGRVKTLWQFINDNKIVSGVVTALLIAGITGGAKACNAAMHENPDLQHNTPPSATSTPASTTPRSTWVTPSTGVPGPAQGGPPSLLPGYPRVNPLPDVTYPAHEGPQQPLP